MTPSLASTTTERTISAAEAAKIAELFRLMGDTTRTRILFTLLDCGELYVSRIAELVEASETTVSHALRLLRAGHVVSSRREGRHIAYSLADDHVRYVLSMTRDHLDHQDTP